MPVVGHYEVVVFFPLTGIRLEPRFIRSFYQPGDVEQLTLGGKTWVVTADTGAIREYRFSDCTFDESVIARTWIGCKYIECD
jgi:hypothetical protein